MQIYIPSHSLSFSSSSSTIGPIKVQFIFPDLSYEPFLVSTSKSPLSNHLSILCLVTPVCSAWDQALGYRKEEVKEDINKTTLGTLPLRSLSQSPLPAQLPSLSLRPWLMPRRPSCLPDPPTLLTPKELPHKKLPSTPVPFTLLS